MVDSGPARRVLIVEDHSVVAESLAESINVEPDLECVGIAPDAPDAVSMNAALRPDTVLMDWQLPTGDGMSLSAALLDARPELRIIVLTGQPRLDRERAALVGGAIGYLGKDAKLSDVLAALRTADKDHPARDPRLLNRASDASERWRLTPRESEVLQLLAAGRHVHDIARDLGLSTFTTRDYVKSILKKLGARSQLEAVATASREGLVSIG